MKAVVAAFNQEKALVGAFSVIVLCTTMDCHFSSIPATLISSFEPGRDHAMGTSTVMNGQADGVL